jgi:hypothetical protein
MDLRACIRFSLHMCNFQRSNFYAAHRDQQGIDVARCLPMHSIQFTHGHVWQHVSIRVRRVETAAGCGRQVAALSTTPRGQ